MELSTILWMFVLGSMVATLTVYYNSRFLGRFVRALIAIDATSPESALTMKELGIKSSPALRQALKPDGSFAQIVIKTADNRYYIAPEKVPLAKVKYRTKDTTLLFVLMSLAIILIAGIAFNWLLPDLVDAFNQNFSGIFGLEA